MIYEVPYIYGKKGGVTVSVPGSKSITNRALLLAALSRGVSVIHGAGFSDDSKVFLSCLKNLGIECEVCGADVKINGCGGVLPVKKADINVGSAGTAARFFTALAAFCDCEINIDCSEQMRRRPISPLISALKSAGAQIQSSNGGFPLTVRGNPRPLGRITVDVGQSSQFLSALLISSVCAQTPVEIEAAGKHGMDYVNMTVDMMWSFGADVQVKDGAYAARGSYSARIYDVEPDMSAAAYFYAANRILGTDIKVKGMMPASMQGDLAFIKLIGDFDGGTLDMGKFSDQVLTLAAIAPYFSKPTRICGAAHIRGQECDRISAAVNNLRALGVKCEEYPDGLEIYPSQPKGCLLPSYGDHRVAMAFTLTGLRAEGVKIADAEVCSKTFGDYFSVWDAVCEKLSR